MIQYHESSRYGHASRNALDTMIVNPAIQAFSAARPRHSAEPSALLLAGLRSRNPARRHEAIEASLSARAFVAGFARGADPGRSRRRHVVDVHHAHWLRGYEAGRRAADQAATRFLGDQLRRRAGAPNGENAAITAPRPTPPAQRCAPLAPQLTLF
jgi:hypothetical protein